jgi:lipopolysaccharide export system permease protein
MKELLKQIYDKFLKSEFYSQARKNILHVLIMLEDIIKDKYTFKKIGIRTVAFFGKIRKLKFEDIRNIRYPVTLYKMLFKSFFSWFAVAQFLFVLILLIIDLFFKLNDYLNFKVPIYDILLITFIYIPKSVSTTIPVAIMFGITMAIGSFYNSNELIAIYTAGISLFKFAFPLIVFNLLLSVSMIFIDANFVIPVERFRTDYYESSIKKNDYGKFDNENITIRGEDDYFWNVERFISSQNTLMNVIVFRINADYHVDYRLDAQKAVFGKNGWVFYSGVLREWDAGGKLAKETRFQKMADAGFRENPSTFKRMQDDIENMTISEASDRIKFLKKKNIEYYKELTGYYKKFAFPFSLLIAALFAIGVSTISKTNVLIMSLFFSIGLTIIYYIMQLILNVLASTGKIPPIIGAWLALIIFFPITLVLIKNAKT